MSWGKVTGVASDTVWSPLASESATTSMWISSEPLPGQNEFVASLV